MIGSSRHYRFWNNLRRTSGEAGFTIVELMIALSIMSVILVISSVVLINLGVLYHKGVTQSKTQNITRNIINELAGQVEMGSANPYMPGGNVICMGSQRYTFTGRNNMLDPNDSNDHALWRDTMTSASTANCTPYNFGLSAAANNSIDGSGTELLLPYMQLADFSITGPPATPTGIYSITVTVVYGDIVSDSTIVSFPNGHARCSGAPGTEYCAVSSLTQNVARRTIN